MLPCAVTCSSLAGPEPCTQQQDAGSNSAESVLVCREVWLLWQAKVFTCLCLEAAMSVLQHQSLCQRFLMFCWAADQNDCIQHVNRPFNSLRREGKQVVRDQQVTWSTVKLFWPNNRKIYCCFHERWGYMNQRQRSAAFCELDGFC